MVLGRLGSEGVRGHVRLPVRIDLVAAVVDPGLVERVSGTFELPFRLSDPCLQYPGGLADRLVERLRFGGEDVRAEPAAVVGQLGEPVDRRLDARPGRRALREFAANGA